MIEYKEYELKDVCSRLSSGKGIPAAQVHDEGKFPVYGGNGLRGHTDHSNFVGSCAIIGRQGAFCGNVRFFSGEAYMTEHAVVVCANPEHNTHYLAYLLSMMNLGRLSGQSAQPGLSVKTLAKQRISLPSLEVQNKVVAILETLENKIALNNKINDNLEQQALELFSNYQKASDGKIGFTDVIQILGGGTPKTKESAYWNGDIPFFTPKDVGCPYTILTEKTITEDGLNHCNSQLYPVNTVFVTARGTVGKVCMPGVSMAMNQSCYALVGKNLHQLMVYFYTLATVKRLKHKASGAVFDAITTKDFSSEYINRLSEQDEKFFLKLAEPTFQMMLSNIFENKKLENMRDTLLPKLMSGEIKLD